MVKFVILGEKVKAGYLTIITPVGNLLVRAGVHPNVLSVTGLVLSLIAALIYSTGAFFWGACVVTLAGICDTLDGQLARETGKESTFGAFFDSTLDRYSDLFILIGLAWHFAGGTALIFGKGPGIDTFHSPVAVLFIILAAAGSFMVSYTRARAEALGLNCDVGLMQRPERITVLAVGTALGVIPVIGGVLVKSTLLILAILTNLTAIQRILYIRSQFFKESKIQ
jgi:CDP-diacylglycerol--glycerol-3-phosphate 3-phosphatidyltransferase